MPRKGRSRSKRAVLRREAIRSRGTRKAREEGNKVSATRQHTARGFNGRRARKNARQWIPRHVFPAGKPARRDPHNMRRRKKA